MEIQHVEIILIEDNPEEAELTIRNFKKHNLSNKLIHIEDGAEALDFIFARGKYQDKVSNPNLKLILLDLNLPKVDGHEILQQLKSDDRTKNIPVVVLTSSQEESDIMKSYHYGANSYVVKPISFDAFSKAIEELGLYWMALNVNPNS